MKKTILILLILISITTLTSCFKKDSIDLTYHYYSRGENGEFYLKEEMESYYQNDVLSCYAKYYDESSLIESKEWTLDYSYTYYNLITPTYGFNSNYIVTHYKDTLSGETKELNAKIESNTITVEEISGASYTYTLDGKKVIKVERVKSDTTIILEYTYSDTLVTAKATSSTQQYSYIMYEISLVGGIPSTLTVKSYFDNLLYSSKEYRYLDGVLLEQEISSANYSYKSDGLLDYMNMTSYQFDSKGEVASYLVVKLDSLGDYSDYQYYKYEYEKDSNGNITKKSVAVYDQDDELLDLSVDATYTYNYLDKFNSYTRSNSSKTIDYEAHFDKNKKITSEFFYTDVTNGSLTEVYLYDYSKDKLVQKTHAYYYNTDAYTPFEKSSYLFYNVEVELLCYDLYLS